MSPEDDIRALVVEFMAAWNRHDPNAFAEVFSEDADFTNWQGASVHGRAAIAHLHAPVFASRFRESHLSPDAVRIRVLRDGLAGVDVHWRMTGARDAEDRPGPERHGILAWVVEGESAGWRIKVMHNIDTSNFPSIPLPQLVPKE